MYPAALNVNDARISLGNTGSSGHPKFQAAPPGSGNGELKAAMQYMSQSFRIKDQKIKDLFLDIAAKEPEHTAPPSSASAPDGYG